MYMNEGATATLAVESEDRGFRSEPDRSRMEAREPRPKTRRLLTQLARETSVNARAECVNALTRLEAKEGLPAVVDALDDEHAAVRLAAVRGVYRLAGREGAGLLIRMLHDASEDVRHRAATCLGWIGHKPAEADLLPLLADSSAFVRRAAVNALESTGSSRAATVTLMRLSAASSGHLSDPTCQEGTRPPQAGDQALPDLALADERLQLVA